MQSRNKLRWERLYGELGLANWRSSSRRAYREHLIQRMGELESQHEAWRRLRRGWGFGDEPFVEEMKEKLLELAATPRDRESWNDAASEELEEERARRLLLSSAYRLSSSAARQGRPLERIVERLHDR